MLKLYAPGDWPESIINFTRDEMKCKHTGDCLLDPNFLNALQECRTLYGKGMKVTSGYRSPEHPVEAKKDQPGAHTLGQAVDIAVSGSAAYDLLYCAMEIGFVGIGIKQSGPHEGRFLHLDMVTAERFPRPAVWSY